MTAQRTCGAAGYNGPCNRRATFVVFTKEDNLGSGATDLCAWHAKEDRAAGTPWTDDVRIVRLPRDAMTYHVATR